MLRHPQEAAWHRRTAGGQNRIKHFQSEGTYNDHLLQLLGHFGADEQLEHIIKGTVQI